MAYKTEKSKELFQKAQECLVGGLSSSFHKAPWNDYPIYMDHGKGSKLYDVDGNSYIDYLNAFGPNILGFVNENQTKAVIEQLQKGTLLAAPNEDLITLCNKLVEYVPCAEKVYGFMNSGSEANMNAFRVARAHTGKKKIVKIEGGYNGSTDEEKVSVEASEESMLGSRENPNKLKHLKGQMYPDNVIIAQFNDLENIEAIFKVQGDEIAAFILEPIMANAEPVYPEKGFLERLGGAQEYFGVKPDLACFGKAIGNGYPISCVVGKEEVLAAATHSSGTFAANALCVAAALATIRELEKPGFYENLEAKGNKIINGVQEICKKYGMKCYTRAVGGLWTVLFGTDEPIHDYRDHYKKVDKVTYRKLVQGCMENGIRLNPWRGRNYVNPATTDEDIEYSLKVFDELLGKIIAGEM